VRHQHDRRLDVPLAHIEGGEVVAVHDGHVDVDQDEIRLGLALDVLALGGVGRQDVEAGGLQRGAVAGSGLGVVVDDHDQGHRLTPSPLNETVSIADPDAHGQGGASGEPSQGVCSFVPAR
jgi:hypothetical protein